MENITPLSRRQWLALAASALPLTSWAAWPDRSMRLVVPYAAGRGADNAARVVAQRLGDRPALTPKHSASAWSTYRFTPLWRVGGGVNYRGEQNPDQNRNLTAQAFTTFDAMAEHAVTDNTTVKLNISNLTNKLYADALYRGFYTPGAPRRIELSLKSMF